MSIPIYRNRPKTDGHGPPTIDGSPVNNELLLNLPTKECAAIFYKLAFLPNRTHDVLHEAGEPVLFAYFINSGLASVLSVLADGKSVEVGLTGKEGFVGLPLIVGLKSTPTRVVIQVECSEFRISEPVLIQLL